MSKFTKVWDEENKRFVYKPAEEETAATTCCVYGGYKWCEEAGIDEVKAELLEEMFDTIRELAKRDDFWIIKKLDENLPCPIAGMENPHTVGWKVTFDQMGQKERPTKPVFVLG